MLISDYMKQMNKEMHSDAFYGSGKVCFPNGDDAFYKHVSTVTQFLNEERTSILDYGCGKQEFAKRLPRIDVRSYDPCVEGVDERPEPADIVVCIDVMEHVESQYTDNVLKDIASLMKHVCYMSIATAEAKRKYPDGQNTHLNVKDATWWHQKLSEYFDIRTYRVTDNRFFVILKEIKNGRNNIKN